MHQTGTCKGALLPTPELILSFLLGGVMGCLLLQGRWLCALREEEVRVKLYAVSWRQREEGWEESRTLL